jgi:hypothetical protein
MAHGTDARPTCQHSGPGQPAACKQLRRSHSPAHSLTTHQHAEPYGPLSQNEPNHTPSRTDALLDPDPPAPQRARGLHATARALDCSQTSAPTRTSPPTRPACLAPAQTAAPVPTFADPGPPLSNSQPYLQQSRAAPRPHRPLPFHPPIPFSKHRPRAVPHPPLHPPSRDLPNEPNQTTPSPHPPLSGWPPPGPHFPVAQLPNTPAVDRAAPQACTAKPNPKGGARPSGSVVGPSEPPLSTQRVCPVAAVS